MTDDRNDELSANLEDADGEAEIRPVTAPPRPFDDEAAAEGAPGSDSAIAAADGHDDGDDDAEDDESAALVAAAVDPGEPVEPEPFEDLEELPSLLEALLFVADHPVDANYLSRALEVSGTRIERALDTLAESLRESKRGIRLQRGPAGVQLVSAPEASAHVERFLGLEANRRLSTAALETLAIIAYRQPITRGQVDAVRGVSSDGAVATLRARELIEPAGHAAGPGRPMLFRTTQRFLEHFGLERPGQLPPLPDDIELPPAEIGAQLGLDEATIAEALRPLPVAEGDDAPEAGDGPADEAAAPALDESLNEHFDPIDAAVAATADIEIPADLQALSEAAEQAFEASRDRRTAVSDDDSGNDGADGADERDDDDDADALDG